VEEVLVTCRRPSGRVVTEVRIESANGAVALRIGFEPSGASAELGVQAAHVLTIFQRHRQPD